MCTIAIVNEKGGTGKTTTSVSLAAALGSLGQRILLVDLDGQASASRWFGVEEDDRLADAILAGGGLQPIENIAPGVSLAPSSGKVDSVARDLRPSQSAQLRKVLREVKPNYDLIIMDCPPSLNNRLIGNALLAATHVLVPVETSIMALDGLQILLTTLDDISDGFEHQIVLAGVVACRYDSRTRLSRLVLEELRRALPNKVFSTVIRENVRMRECPASGQSILDFAPGSHAAEDYLALAQEMLDNPDAWKLPAHWETAEAHEIDDESQRCSVDNLRSRAAATVRANNTKTNQASPAAKRESHAEPVEITSAETTEATEKPETPELAELAALVNQAEQSEPDEPTASAETGGQSSQAKQAEMDELAELSKMMEQTSGDDADSDVVIETVAQDEPDEADTADEADSFCNTTPQASAMETREAEDTRDTSAETTPATSAAQTMDYRPGPPSAPVGVNAWFDRLAEAKARLSATEAEIETEDAASCETQPTDAEHGVEATSDAPSQQDGQVDTTDTSAEGSQQADASQTLAQPKPSSTGTNGFAPLPSGAQSFMNGNGNAASAETSPSDETDEADEPQASAEPEQADEGHTFETTSVGPAHPASEPKWKTSPAEPQQVDAQQDQDSSEPEASDQADTSDEQAEPESRGESFPALRALLRKMGRGGQEMAGASSADGRGTKSGSESMS